MNRTKLTVSVLWAVGLIGATWLSGVSFLDFVETVEAVTIAPANRSLNWKKLILAQDDDIDTSFEILAADNSYAQLAAADTLEFVMSQAADSARVRVTAIRPDSTRCDTLIRVYGTTVVKTATPFMFYESARIDSGDVLTGTLTIRRATGDTQVSQIAIGAFSDDVGQYFVTKGEEVYAALQKVGVTSTTGAVTFELRWYYDWASSRAGTGPYEVVGPPIALTNVLGCESGDVPPTAPRNTPGRCGWISVWGKGGANDSDGFAVIEIHTRGSRR